MRSKLPSLLRLSTRTRAYAIFSNSLVEKLRAQKVVFEELIFPDEIHDLLRWSDWVRSYCATAEFFDRRMAASGERH